MSKTCEITGKKVMFGNNVSKSLNRTKRRFDVNLIKKRFFIPEENKWITLKLSASALKTINKKGISEVLKKARKQERALTNWQSKATVSDRQKARKILFRVGLTICKKDLRTGVAKFQHINSLLTIITTLRFPSMA